MKKEIGSVTYMISLLALALITAPFTGCENPADSSSDGPAASVTVSDWATLAAALENPVVREIGIAEGAGHIVADRAVSTAGAKTVSLSPYTALTVKGLTLNGDLTVAYGRRTFSGAAWLTMQGKVLVSAEKTFLIKENITCNVNDASITVRGLLAFESEDSLPGGTNTVIGGSGKLSFDAKEEYMMPLTIPAIGLLLERRHGGTLVTALPERIISISEDSLVILDAVAEGETPSDVRTVQISNEGIVETGDLEASVDDPYLEFEGGDSAPIDSIAVGTGAQFSFRIKAGLEAGIYRTSVTVSGFSLQRKSFPVIFQVGESGGLTSLRAIAEHLTAGSGTLSQPLSIKTSLNMMYWPHLLEILDEAGDYVSLDLSDCALSVLTESTAFNPDTSTSAGKDRISSLTLPEAAESIPGGTAEAPTFKGFINLVRLEGLNVVSIGAYCFTDCSALEAVDMPLLSLIRDYAFSGCSNLETIELPALVKIEDAWYPYSVGAPFLNCTGLRSVSLPSATTIYSKLFTGCTNLESISLGSEPPPLYYWLQSCATTTKTITIYVPAASLSAYESAWAGKISIEGMSNASSGYSWDDNEATRNNLTVRLAALEE
jgi:hypothetical protein